LTDFFLDAGIAQAAALDEHFRWTGKVVGPLHGVPISFKDHIPVAGSWATHGFTSSLAISETDADLVARLRLLGAVFSAKTNQPQGVLTLEAHSAFGRTVASFFLLSHLFSVTDLFPLSSSTRTIVSSALADRAEEKARSLRWEAPV
jgi:Asp-tRNA(Asn)/Glu-tRNA(Gln) amidotransferase A subunit family amidase